MAPHLAPTRFAPDAMSLPPPPSSDASVPMPPQAELFDGELRVGWVTDRTIGFRGFATASEAAGAAWVAYGVVARRYAGRDHWRPSPVEVAPLSLVRAGDNDVICAGGRPIGALCRPGTSAAHDDATYGFEIEVPPPADHLRVRTSAYLVYRAMRRSGVRWALWSPPIEPPRFASLERVTAFRARGPSRVGSLAAVVRRAIASRVASAPLAALAVLAVLAWFVLQASGAALALGAVAAVATIVALIAPALLQVPDVASLMRREVGGVTRTMRGTPDGTAGVVPGAAAPDGPPTPA